MNLKIQKFDSGYFYGRIYFVDDDGTQNYLVFQPMKKYCGIPSLTSRGFVAFNHISEWKSKGLSNERINVLQHLMVTKYIL